MAEIANIDISLLRTFASVVETGKITKAAERMNMTQSAASQQILRLEALLETNLVERTANRIKLSRDGEKLYSAAVRMIALNDEIVRDMRRAAEEVEVRLGVPHDLVEKFTPSILKAFSASHPEVAVTLVSLSSGELRKCLERGDIDLTLTTEIVGEDGGEALLRDQLVWAGSKNGQAATVRPLAVTLGTGGDRFHEPAAASLTKAGIKWRRITQGGSLGSVFAVLAADMAVAPFLRCTVPPFLRVLDADELPDLPEFEIKMVVPDGGTTPHSAALATCIRAHFSKDIHAADRPL